MTDTEPAEVNGATNLTFEPKEGQSLAAIAAAPRRLALISFDRNELREFISLCGRKVAGSERRDYGIKFTPQKAVFSVYRPACEYALNRTEETLRQARKQCTWSAVAAAGLVLKRGHDLTCGRKIRR